MLKWALAQAGRAKSAADPVVVALRPVPWVIGTVLFGEWAGKWTVPFGERTVCLTGRSGGLRGGSPVRPLDSER